MPILVCGLGSIGRRHLRNLSELGQKVVLLRTGKGTLPEEELVEYPAEKDIERALARWSPEGVIVANPTALHLDLAIPAAESGAHLLIEKPLSHTMERVEKLRAAFAHGGGSLLVGYQFRFHPTLQLVKKWLDERAVGTPISVRVHWGEYLPDWHPWEDYRQSYSARRDLGGGVVLTLCHPFDYLRWFFGEVESVCANTLVSNELDLEVEGTAEAILSFVDGTLGSVHLDYNQRPPVHRLEIVGSEGTLRWDNRDGQALRWDADAGDWAEHRPPEGFERNDLFLAELRHFLKIIHEAEPSRCSLEDGIRALEVALAVHESAAKGRSVQLSAEGEIGIEGDAE